MAKMLLFPLDETARAKKMALGALEELRRAIETDGVALSVVVHVTKDIEAMENIYFSAECSIFALDRMISILENRKLHLVAMSNRTDVPGCEATSSREPD